MPRSGLSNLVQTLAKGNYYDAASSVKNNKIGQELKMADGRVFRYARAGETISIGDVLVHAPDPFAIAATYFGADTSTAPVAGEGGAVGDTLLRICVVTGTATMTADEYADGYLVITDGTGEGQTIPLTGNEANASSGSNLLYLGAPLITALDNTSVGVIIKNPYADLIVANAKDAGGDPDESVAGVACVSANTTNKYFWICTKGVIGVQAGSAGIKAGAHVIIAEDDDGSAQLPVAGENIIHYFGRGLYDTADTIFGPVFIDCE